MPRRPAIARERLIKLLHLPAAGIAHELGCTPDHVMPLLRQDVHTYAPADCGWPVGIHLINVGPKQRAAIEWF